MPNVLAYAEARGTTLRKAAFEAVAAARVIAAGGEVHALLVGPPGIAATAAALGRAGATRVFVSEHPAFAQYNADAARALAAERTKSGGYRAVVFASTAQGRDLAPRVAARLGAALASDVTGITVAGDEISVVHPVYSGKAIATLTVQGTPAVISVRPSTFVAAEDGRDAVVEPIQPVGDPAAGRVVVTELRTGGGAKLDVAEAPIVVSGGRGLKGPENFAIVEALAAAFGNAAVGASRAVVDAGWRGHGDQVGQTGKTVSPSLYVAIGVSGAIQHLAGMRTAKTIVAINKDKDAPIFKIADYGIVGDLFEIVPALTAAVREARKTG
ncbi:MAG TPA: electron transfer flavoprotein subunit alpha/FixB family protein [Gemmatimonadaceae bacterium]|jgi:electron transfer flavoprotein alpha subunit|nr:electron transfer flavoprotein subunit alpha/FixB family protein [Gemmatimonadaceae bacterium]